MSLWQLLAAAAIMAVGAAIQGGIGFGANLVAIPILLLLDDGLVPGPSLVALVVLGTLMTLRERGSAADATEFGWAVGGRLLGTPFGFAAIALVPKERLGIMSGIAILLAVALSTYGYVTAQRGDIVTIPDGSPTPKNLLIAGWFAAFFGTSVAIGGPPMALAYQRYEGPHVRAALSRIAMVGAGISAAVLAIGGEFGTTEPKAIGALICGVVTGFAISSRTASLVDRSATRPIILALCTASATAVLIRAIF